MKEKTKWNNYDALPLILDVTDIQHALLFQRCHFILLNALALRFWRGYGGLSRFRRSFCCQSTRWNEITICRHHIAINLTKQ